MTTITPEEYRAKVNQYLETSRAGGVGANKQPEGPGLGTAAAASAVPALGALAIKAAKNGSLTSLGTKLGSMFGGGSAASGGLETAAEFSPQYSSGLSEALAASQGAGAPTVANAAAADAATPGIGASIGSVVPSAATGSLAGAAGTAGGAAALYMYLDNLQHNGGKNVVEGHGKSRDYTDTFLDVNPVTAPINMGLRLFGKDSVGKMLFAPSTKEIQRNTWRGLANGADAPLQNYLKTVMDKTSANYGGKVGGGVADDFVGEHNGGWVNNKFAKSGNADDLQWGDVVGSASNIKRFGNDWFSKFSPEQRKGIAQLEVDNKSLSTKKGMVNTNFSDDLNTKINNYLAGAKPAPAKVVLK